ncbi:MAG: HDOD domain-containing protein [Candidatus Kapabacteria bacterium]|nr:HDOD domain-containing protein [Candidatus Kapabacteria bacterium]
MIQVEHFIRKLDELPTLPTIYTALSDVMANPRSTVSDAANIISRDQASTAKVLKHANSSIYGIRGQISTISQAIFFIGFEEVKNLIIALSIMKMFSGLKVSKTLNPVDLWKHSIAVGVISRLIGKGLGIKHLEDFFIAGILHDVGKLMFYKFLPTEYSEVVNYSNEKKISLREAEAEKLGITHTIVGEMLAEKWRLPRNIKNTISSHHSCLVDGKIDETAYCVHLADIIAHFMQYNISNLGMIPKPNINLWNEFNFSEGFFSKLYPQIIRDYEESASLLLNK